jgi:hypothetical protein
LASTAASFDRASAMRSLGDRVAMSQASHGKRRGARFRLDASGPAGHGLRLTRQGRRSGLPGADTLLDPLARSSSTLHRCSDACRSTGPVSPSSR